MYVACCTLYCRVRSAVKDHYSALHAPPRPRSPQPQARHCASRARETASVARLNKACHPLQCARTLLLVSVRACVRACAFRVSSEGLQRGRGSFVPGNMRDSSAGVIGLCVPRAGMMSTTASPKNSYAQTVSSPALARGTGISHRPTARMPLQPRDVGRDDQDHNRLGSPPHSVRRPPPQHHLSGMLRTIRACLGVEPRDVGRDDQDPLGVGLGVLRPLQCCEELVP